MRRSFALRRVLVTAALLGGTVALVLTLWQDQPISGGFVLAATLAGLSSGAIFAIAASGIAISYLTSGVFNLASGAMGMFMAFVYWELHVARGWPMIVALVLVVCVAAPLFGAFLDLLIMNRLRDAPLPQQLVANAAVMLALIGLAGILWPANRTRVVPQFFADQGFRLPGGLFFSYHRAAAILVAAAVGVLLWLLLNRTRLGLSMRAVVSQPELAETYGVSSRFTSAASWAIGSVMASIAAIFLAAEISLNPSVLTLLIIDSFAALVLGRFGNLALVFAGGLFIGLLNSYAITFLDLTDRLANFRAVIPTLILFVALLLLPQPSLPERKSPGRPLVGTRMRALPYARPPTLLGTGAGMAVLCASAVAAAFLLPTVTVNRFTQAMSLAIIMLSLVLLTGWAGETSLAQMTFAGFGTVAMFAVAGDSGSPLGLVAAVVLGALVGLVVALPALRLHGIYLALASLAIARIAEELIFPQEGILSSRSGGVHIAPLSLFGYRLESPRVGLVLLAVVFASLGMALVLLRRSRYGRRLAAMKDSPAAYEAIGHNIHWSRIAVYMVSAGMAGLGGALFAAVRNDVSTTDFTMLSSVSLLLLLIIGGVNSVGGALVGALFGTLLLIAADEWQSNLLTGLILLGPGLAALAVAQSPVGAIPSLAEALRRGFPRWNSGDHSGPDPVLSRLGVESRLRVLGHSADFTPADLDVIDDVLATPQGYRDGARR